MRIGTIFTVCGAALLAAGCGGETESESTPVAQTGADAGDVAMAPPPDNAAMEGGDDAPAAGDPAMANAANGPQANDCPPGPDVYCRGPVLVRASNLIISRTRLHGDGGMDVEGKVTFSVENRTDAPLRFNMLRREVTNLTLANGVVLSGNYAGTQPRNISGLTPCQRDAESCLNAQADDFVVLEAGESPARFNVSFEERVDPQNANSVPRVSTADTNVQLLVVGADGSDRKISASFSQVPVFNNLAD